MRNSRRRSDMGSDRPQGGVVGVGRPLKRCDIAYRLLTLFPLGLHRFYLRSPRIALAYPAASTAAMIMALAGLWGTAALVFATVVAGALFDVAWIDSRVTALNPPLPEPAGGDRDNDVSPPQPQAFDDELRRRIAGNTDPTGPAAPAFTTPASRLSDRRANAPRRTR